MATITPSKAQIAIGEELTFTISGDTFITAYSSNNKVAFVSYGSTSIIVKGYAEGEDTINFVLNSGGRMTASVTVGTTSGGGSGGSDGDTTIPVTGIQVDTWEVNLTVGQTRQMIASVLPPNATNQGISWYSNAQAVATVSQTGLITAKSVGYAMVTATTNEGEHQYNIHVNVTSPPSTTVPVSSVSLNKTSLSLTVGKTETLTATVAPTNATNQTVTWSSNNQIVATVSNGTVTAKAKGTAIITVTTADGNKTATCNVTVTESTSTTPPTTNNVPTIGVVLVSNETSNGTYTLSYTASDSDNDTLTHKLKIGTGSYTTINPTKQGNNYTYNGSGLGIGSHTGKIQVSDGKTSVESPQFAIEIRQQATGVKAQLKEAKDIYDAKHKALKDTINIILADGKFEDTGEQSTLNQALSAYNTALSNYQKMAQKAIDFIGDGKADNAVDASKTYTNAQIKIVNDSITQRVEKIEQKQTTTDGKVTSLETWKQEAQQQITPEAIISTVTSTVNQAKQDAITSANKTTDDKLMNYSTTTQMNSAIEQKANSITQRVETVEKSQSDVKSEVSALNTRVQSAEQKITTNAIVSTVTSSQTYKDALTGKVNKTEVISSINQTAEAVKIKANKIQLEGAVTAGESGRCVKIENANYGVFNGDTNCMRFGYKTWNGWTGVPEFLMGYKGMRYSTTKNTGEDASYFGMQTWGRGVKNNNTYTYHDMYYRSDKYADQHHLRFTENGLMQLRTLKRLELKAGSDVYVQVDTTDGLSFPQGVNTFGVNDTIWLKNSNFGIVWGKYSGKEEYNLRPTNNNLTDLGHASYRYRTIYATNGTVNTSDIRLKENIIPITNKKDEVDTQNEVPTSKEFYHFVKDLPMYSYDYISESHDRSLHNIGFIAQEISDTKVGNEFIFEGEDGLYQYNMQGYVGVLAVALQEGINKIDKLEEDKKNLEQENNELRSKLENIENELAEIKQMLMQVLGQE